jgi:ribosomal protein S18 acetylase RimI-like enzyme
MYYNKYIKYKSKYLKYKCQLGGGITFKIIKNQTELNYIIPELNLNKYPNSKCYIFYEDDKIVGFLFLQKTDNSVVHSVLKEIPKDEIFIWGVEVLPEFRGKGIGYTMMKMVLKDDKKYFLRVNKDNIPAVKLYTKLGFTIFREESIIVDGKFIPRYIMKKN